MLKSFSIPLFVLASGERKAFEFRYEPLSDDDYEELVRVQSLTGEERRAGLFKWLSGVLVDMKIAEGERIELSLERIAELGDTWAYYITRLLMTRTYPGLTQIAGLQIRYQSPAFKNAIRKRLPETVMRPEDLTIYELAWEFKQSPDEVRGWSIEDRNWITAVASARYHAQKYLAQRAASSHG